MFSQISFTLRPDDRPRTLWAPAVAISQLSAVQLGAFRQNSGADGLAAARRLGYAALPISKPF